jgi:hypothetical protein
MQIVMDVGLDAPTPALRAVYVTVSDAAKERSVNLQLGIGAFRSNP